MSCVYMANKTGIELDLIEKAVLEEGNSKIITQYRRVSDNLALQLKLKKEAEAKIKEKSKHLLNLEVQRHHSDRESMELRRKRLQLEEAQVFSTYMIQLKFKSQMEKDSMLGKRKSECSFTKRNIQESRRQSMSAFSEIKNKKIEKYRQDAMRLSSSLNERKKSDFIFIKNLKDSVKEKEMMSKDRLWQYERFKFQQAQDNYRMKLDQQWQKSQQNERILNDLRKKLKQEATTSKGAFQIEDKLKLQSIYLTD